MKKLFILLSAGAVVVLLVFSGYSVFSAIPHLVNYQGMLTDNSGTPLNGDYSITFKIYNSESAGTKKWEETQSNVSVTNGLFNATLGSVIPIALDFSEDYWLDITVGAEHMPTRLKFTSVGYAYRARWAGRADTADYALSSPTGPGDYTWTFRISDTADTTIITGGAWGIARYGNVLYGNKDSTHVNLGVACTTGRSGYNRRYCSIAGGWFNAAGGERATVSGGEYNNAIGNFATIGGGTHNLASGTEATVGGGWADTASGEKATIGGGQENISAGYFTTIGGGLSNKVNGWASIVSGGSHNVASGTNSSIGGGMGDTVKASFGGVFSGRHNQAGNTDTDSGAFVGGGDHNHAMAEYTMIGGGRENTATVGYATIGGGYNNSATNWWTTVGGGLANTANADRATVGGGWNNIASGNQATIGGGYDNRASNYHTTIGGGYRNTAGGYAATVSGGYENFNGGEYSVIPGGRADTISSNADGSMAFGRYVYVSNDNYVILFDSDNNGHLQINRDHRDAGPTGYVIRVGMNTSNGNGAYLTGGGVWTDITTSSKKEDFERLDGAQVLEKIENIPITRWKFIGTEERHIGPIAEDFFQAFGCGAGIPEDDSTSIAAMDLAGISLVAIQEITRIIKDQQKEIELLKAEVKTLQMGKK